MTLRDRYSQRIGLPPTNDDGALSQWMLDITDAVNGLPRISTFSYETPESNVTASVPTLGFNEASGHTRLWIKESGDGNTGWLSLTKA